MEENSVETNSLKAWLLAARPKTLAGAAVPVMIATALAWANHGGNIQWVPTVLCFLFAFVMQIDANFVNDYFDFIKGNDDQATRLGPLRACSQGWITPSAMRIGLGVTTSLACAVGLPLVFYGGMEMVLVGMLCVLFCFLYTTHLSYMGMGDVLVLLFFGVVPVCMTYYLIQPVGCHRITWEVFWASVACGVVIDALLLINNYRDMDNDRRDGKITLVVRVGGEMARLMYLGVGFVALAIGIAYALHGHVWASVLPLGYLLLHCKTYRHMVQIGSGRQLNEVLGETARNMFVYGILVSIGLILS